MRHDTAYTYEEEVQSSYNELRLLPAESGSQHVVQARVHTTPPGLQQHFTDYYGNHVVYLEVTRRHRRLEIRTDVLVDTQGGALEVPGRRPEEFLQAGRLTRLDEVSAERLACLSATDVRGLMAGVRELLRYESGVTGTDTDVNTALRLGRGVCQEFAHVFVSVCRFKGIPARYVGGYLLQSGPGGPQESHAWAEVYADGEWRACDPTHGCLSDERYLGVAVGRDYADIPPVKGVFLGPGVQGMRVRLRVVEQVAASDQ